MRTVKRESVKLNEAKFKAIEKIARAFADDKQTHLDFYQRGLNFSGAKSFRLRRNELKSIGYHAWTPLPVHASDLAVKEAFDADYGTDEGLLHPFTPSPLHPFTFYSFCSTVK